MAYFKELIEAAGSTGELRKGDAQYVLGLWEASDECRDLDHARERWKWWQKNAEAIAKERADAWAALVAVEPFFREDMPDGPDGERGCATPEFRNAFRLVLAALADREALLKTVTPIT